MSDTPRTDGLLERLEKGRFTVFDAQPHLVELARTLERQLTAAQSVRPEAAEMAETLKRLRSQIPGCDCDNPAQCWESCGTLGHSEEHMKVIKDSNKP